MAEEPLLRIFTAFPPAPTWRQRARQVLWGVLHVIQDDPKPAIFAVNPAGYGKLLFTTATVAEANEKGERVARELDELGLQAWCERYRVPLSFVEALGPPEGVTGLRRFQPLL
jgi:hypothetical protein